MVSYIIFYNLNITSESFLFIIVYSNNTSELFQNFHNQNQTHNSTYNYFIILVVVIQFTLKSISSKFYHIGICNIIHLKINHFNIHNQNINQIITLCIKNHHGILQIRLLSLFNNINSAKKIKVIILTRDLHFGP